tara:strand:+ start:5087 stop:5392 length:306 start_codon:yes stop_codon:yes gene_type:complete
MNEEILIEELIRFIAGIERKMSRRELIEYNSIVSSYLLNQDSLMIDRASAKKRLIKGSYLEGYKQSVVDHGCQSFESVDKDWLEEALGEYLDALDKKVNKQ